MYFLYLCYTVLVRSLILFLFPCRNGRTPSRRMQVSPLSSWSTKAGGWHRFAISRFPVSPVLHHLADAPLKLLLWSGGYLWFWAKKESMISGGRLKWSLGAWGWTICEFKSPFNICPSQRDMGRGERSGRRWEGFWSLVLLWHIGNGSWFPPILLSPFVFLVHLPVGIFAAFFCSPLSPQAFTFLPNKILSFPHHFHLQAIYSTLLIFSINNYQTLIHSNSNKAGDVDLWASWGELDLKSI